MKIPYSQLQYGNQYGVTVKEAKRAYLSRMSKKFRRKVNVRFVRK